MVTTATLALETPYLERGRHVIGIDEVGRGALAGPVSVGVCLLSALAPPPHGLIDSKLLRPAAREALVPAITQWARAVAVGHASPAEIDSVGIIAALRLAAHRALGVVAENIGATTAVLAAASTIILDGPHNWVAPAADLFDQHDWQQAQVVCLPKADQQCASVAAASVVAKVERDRIMCELPDPGYGFAQHKGYGAASHRAAIATLGVSDHHRRSWKLQ